MQRNVDPLVRHTGQHRICDHIAHGAFLNTADRPISFDRVRGFRHNSVADLFQRGRHFSDTRNCFGIFRYRSIDQDRLTHCFGDIAIVVESNVQLTQIFAVGVGLHNRSIAHHGRRRTFGFLVGIAQQGVGVPAHDHIHTRGIGRNHLVDGIAGVAEHDDLVDPLGGHTVHFALHGSDWIGEGDIVAGAGQLMRVLRCEADKADLLAAPLDYCGFSECVCQQRLCTDVRVGHQDGKLNRGHKRGQHFGAIVKFVVADGHAVIAQLVHHLSGHLALVLGVEQRALELVAAIHKDRIVAAGLGVFDRCDQTRCAAKAFAFGIVLNPTWAVIFADRLEPRVEVIGVQNRDCVISAGHACREAQGGGAQKESFHGGPPLE